MEIRGNKIISTEALGQDMEFITLQGQLLGIELTPKQLEELQKTGKTFKTSSSGDIVEEKIDITRTEDTIEELMGSLIGASDIKDLIKEATPSSKETKESTNPDDLFEFDETKNEETIGEYLSYLFSENWNIFRIQVKRGISIEESKLIFLQNGKCRMERKTISGLPINFLISIAQEVRPTRTGADARVYDSVITKNVKTSKMVRFFCGDITFTYELKEKRVLAQEREVAMWR